MIQQQLQHPSVKEKRVPLLQRLLYAGLASLMSGGWVVGLSRPMMGQPQPESASTATLSDTILAVSDRPLLRSGSEGPAVQAVQTLLELLGYYSGQIDGRYQQNTATAVSAFQQAAGLEGDGIVGPTTWAKLLPLPDQLGSETTVESATTSLAPDTATDDAASTATTPPEQPAEPTDASPSEDSSTADNDPIPSGAVLTSNTVPEAPATPAPTPASTPPASPPTDITLPTLRVGMRGPAVENLQERLRALGWLQGSVDGVFGSQTEASVKAAQRSFNLTPDGIVGPATWAALLQ